MGDIDNEALECDKEALKNYQESRKRLRCASSSPTSDITEARVKKEKVNDESSWKTTSAWQEDPSGLYGLKPEYLRILGIEPPICNWVCVENFRCDKSELREILELAGYVVICTLIYSRHKHAKVMYSHPLEAVQAISMLNKQMFYGRALSVTMIRYPLDSVILPKALPNIGPGFGSYGKPLKDIVKHYERFLNDEPNSLNTLLFAEPGEKDDALENLESVGREISKDEIYDRYQFSKQFQIRNVEDDSDDTKSEKDSKDCSWGADSKQNDASKTPTDPKYSPRSPTRSPLRDVDVKSIDSSKIMRNTVPVENLGSRATYSWDKPSNAMASSGLSTVGPFGPMGVISGQNNSRMPTPMGQGPTVSNVAASIGPKFGPNPLANPTVGPVYRPNVPMTGSGAVIMGQNLPPNPIAGSGYRPNVPMAGPNGPGPRPNVPISGPNITTGLVVGGLRPTAGLSTGSLLPPPTNFAVQFRNLPPTTTFTILSEKMSQCGQVLSVQLTTPGCATVSFSHPTHAQRCFLHFNNLCVDGCVIQARIV